MYATSRIEILYFQRVRKSFTSPCWDRKQNPVLRRFSHPLECQKVPIVCKRKQYATCVYPTQKFVLKWSPIVPIWGEHNHLLKARPAESFQYILSLGLFLEAITPVLALLWPDRSVYGVTVVWQLGLSGQKTLTCRSCTHNTCIACLL